MKRFIQQAWNPQLDIEIKEGGVVTVDGIEVSGDREKALANIILRLNAYFVSSKESQTSESEEEMLVNGTDIKSVGQFSYGMLPVFMKDGTEHRISPEQLTAILKQHDFKAEPKRKFHHLTPIFGLDSFH